jgi:hypothetical protein
VWQVDIGVNYFLARSEVLRKHPWDQTIVPIGGEHGDFFMTLKQAGRTVVWQDNCHIKTFDAIERRHPDYMTMRRRAQSTGHKIMCEKWGIKDWLYKWDA